MSYQALDVAHYIINHCREKQYFLSNLALQKLLYFIQAKFIIEKDTICFNDPIEAWDFGPVVPNIYKRFEKYGAGSLPEIKTYLDTSDGVWHSQQKTFDPSIIEDSDQLLINRVLDETCMYNVIDLVDISCNQDPWRKHHQRHKTNTIPIQALKDYFLTESEE